MQQAIGLPHDMSALERIAGYVARPLTKQRAQWGLNTALIDAAAHTQATWDHTRVDNRIQWISTAAQSGAGLTPLTSSPRRDLTLLPALIPWLNQRRNAAIDATDVAIDHPAELPAVSPTERAHRPLGSGAAHLSQRAFGGLHLREGELKKLAIRMGHNEALPQERAAGLSDAPSPGRLPKVSPYVIQRAGSSRSSESLLAASALDYAGARAIDWLKRTDPEVSAELKGDRRVDPVPGCNADAPQSAESLQSARINIPAIAYRQFEPILRNLLRQENDPRKLGQTFDARRYPSTAEIGDLVARYSSARPESMYDPGRLRQLATAATKFLPSGGESGQPQQTRLQKPTLSIAGDAPLHEAVRALKESVDGEAIAHNVIPARAPASLKGSKTLPERVGALEDGRRFDVRAVLGQHREQGAAESARTLREQVPATGSRMPAALASAADSAPAQMRERPLGILEPSRDAVAGSSGHTIDIDRLTRAMEMFIQGLERLLGAGSIPPLGAARSQITPLPPALPGTPTPFVSRIDGSRLPS